MNDISIAIDNLERLSAQLEKSAAKPHLLDTSWGNALEAMSYGLFSQAQDLKSLYGIYTGDDAA